LHIRLERIPDFCVEHGALGYDGEIDVIAKVYFARQAAILFGLAKATQDPKVSAALMDKAADIKSRVNGPATSAPEDEPPIAT
jgi:hypothetical protein